MGVSLHPGYGRIRAIDETPSRNQAQCAILCSMSRFAFVIAVLMLLSGFARAESPDAAFRDGLAAYNTGDYARALAAWEPLAVTGEPRAQAGLGFMYYSGR